MKHSIAGILYRRLRSGGLRQEGSRSGSCTGTRRCPLSCRPRPVTAAL